MWTGAAGALYACLRFCLHSVDGSSALAAVVARLAAVGAAVVLWVFACSAPSRACIRDSAAVHGQGGGCCEGMPTSHACSHAACLHLIPTVQVPPGCSVVAVMFFMRQARERSDRRGTRGLGEWVPGQVCCVYTSQVLVASVSAPADVVSPCPAPALYSPWASCTILGLPGQPFVCVSMPTGMLISVGANPSVAAGCCHWCLPHASPSRLCVRLCQVVLLHSLRQECAANMHTVAASRAPCRGPLRVAHRRYAIKACIREPAGPGPRCFQGAGTHANPVPTPQGLRRCFTCCRHVVQHCFMHGSHQLLWKHSAAGDQALCLGPTCCWMSGPGVAQEWCVPHYRYPRTHWPRRGSGLEARRECHVVCSGCACLPHCTRVGRDFASLEASAARCHFCRSGRLVLLTAHLLWLYAAGVGVSLHKAPADQALVTSSPHRRRSWCAATPEW